MLQTRPCVKLLQHPQLSPVTHTSHSIYSIPCVAVSCAPGYQASHNPTMLACHNHAALVTRLSDPATRRRIVLAWSGANEPVFTVYPIAFAATLASPGSFYTVHPGHNDRGHAIWLFNMPVEQSLLPPLVPLSAPSSLLVV